MTARARSEGPISAKTQIEGTAPDLILENDMDDERSSGSMGSISSSVLTIDRLTDIISRSNQDIQRLQNELRRSHDDKQLILADSIKVMEEMKRFKDAFEAERQDRLYAKKGFEDTIQVLETEKSDLLSAANGTLQSLQSAVEALRQKQSGLLQEIETLKAANDDMNQQQDAMKEDRIEWEQERKEMMEKQTLWEQERVELEETAKQERLQRASECRVFDAKNKEMEEERAIMEIEQVEFESMQRILVDDLKGRMKSMKIAFVQSLCVVCPLGIIISYKLLSDWHQSCATNFDTDFSFI